MCRIFGFRSVIQSQVHRSLVSADNALMQQSDRHPDGWGVAYYNDGAPHVIKSVSSAQVDHLFRRVSGIVASETVLAHLRKATQGSLSIINTHPFQFGRWVFVHNGNIGKFDELRDELVGRVPPVLRRYILGDTDSEVLFYLLLGHMAKQAELSRAGFPLEGVMTAVKDTVEEITSLTGEICYEDAGPAHGDLSDLHDHQRDHARRPPGWQEPLLQLLEAALPGARCVSELRAGMRGGDRVGLRQAPARLQRATARVTTSGRPWLRTRSSASTGACR